MNAVTTVLADAVQAKADDRRDPHAQRVAVIETAIGQAPDDLAAALAEPVLRALAVLADDPTALGPYSTLATNLVSANKALRRADLDRAVGTFRKKGGADESVDNTPDELREGVEPWGEPVDAAVLLGEIETLVARHCVIPSAARDGVALWVLAAYLIDAFRVFPKLLLHSPQKRCGKTTTLEVLTALVPKPLTGSNVTPSVIFRAIETWRVSVLLDEVDTFLHGNDELRGIVNSGHTRATAYVWRVEGETVREPVRYSTWSPMVLAMIGNPPGTVLDRAIPIALERKTATDHVERLPRTLVEDCLDIRRRCRRWADDHLERVAAIDPTLSAFGNDRAADNWAALVAVADVAGGAWPARARAAHRTITLETVGDSDDLSIELLRDLRAMVEDDPSRSTWPSSTLVDRLNDLPERPWPTLVNGRELTAHRLAKLLRPYRITSGSTRQGGGTVKGYKAEKLRAAFDRYLASGDPPGETGTTAQASIHAGSSDFGTGTTPPGVPVSDRPRASVHAGCAGVPVSEGGTPEREREPATATGTRRVTL